MRKMLALGIESTCDETGASIVSHGKTILSNILCSSAEIHQQYGGVFPELACRRHIEAIIPVVDEALQKANVRPSDIDVIAVAKGPGLVGALLIGMNAAKGLSIAWNKPLIGVNHVEAHLYASMMHLEQIPLPALGIVLSGGHTLIVKICDIGKYEPMSTTVDDAIGEAFDKVAVLLGMPYPGGPCIEELAKKGDPQSFHFKAGTVKKNPLYFSFSGLKTSVMYAVHNKGLSENERANIAASFQCAAFSDIIKKTKLALSHFSDAKAIFLGGGVCNNNALREAFENAFSIPIFWPPKDLSMDNAAMIAGLGGKKFLTRPKGDGLDLDVQTRIPL